MEPMGPSSAIAAQAFAREKAARKAGLPRGRARTLHPARATGSTARERGSRPGGLCQCRREGHRERGAGRDMDKTLVDIDDKARAGPP